MKIDKSKLKKVDYLKQQRSLMKPKDLEKLKKGAKGETEATLQGLCEAFLVQKGLWYLRIPNEVYSLCSPQSRVHIRVKKKISENLAGIPDLMIFKKEYIAPHELECQDNSCLLVELKTKVGRLSPRQKKWKQETIVHVIRTFEDFKELIDKWA